MIHKRIRPFLHLQVNKKRGENTILEGNLVCCNNIIFEIFSFGDIKNSLFSKMYMIPQNNTLVMEARCKKCGNRILVFDNRIDGYEQAQNNQGVPILKEPVYCMKCHANCFSVEVKYEYPDVKELKEIGITNIDNMFTWVWITIRCNRCGAIYKNFIDFETA